MERFKLFGLLSCKGSIESKVDCFIEMVRRGDGENDGIKKSNKELKRIFKEICGIASWELCRAVEMIGHTKQIYTEEEL